MDDLVAGDDGVTDAALDKWVADAEAGAAKYQHLAAVMDRVRVSVSSPDNLVTITVNASGNITDLRIADRAMSGPGKQLAGQILTAIRRAQADIAARMAEVMQATIGDDTTVMNAVLAEYHDKFPEPPPSTPPPPSGVTVQDIGAPREQQPQQQQPQPQRVARAVPLRPRGADERWNDDGGSGMEEVDT